MYNEIYAAWRKETEETSLASLPPDFYKRITDYLTRVAEDSKTIDKKSLKANLLDHEAHNVGRMLKELLWARYKKLIKSITKSHKLPFDSLTVEEAKASESFVIFTDAYQKFAKALLQDQLAQVGAEPTHKRLVLRFSKNIPSIIGMDMKTYGPFMAEDVASLPAENARILIKQGLAVLVEVS